MRLFLKLIGLPMLICAPLCSAQSQAKWIAPSSTEPCPVNDYTYLRKTVHIEQVPADASLHVAADSNAHIWINGSIVRRKITRFFEASITTENIDAAPLLHPGDNTVVILLDSWGPIITFQRAGCAHEGIYVDASWIHSDGTWRTHHAGEFAHNVQQILGVPNSSNSKGGTRIRFAQFVDVAKVLSVDTFRANFDDSAWPTAQIVTGGPWPAHPLPSETSGQHEEAVFPPMLLAHGDSDERHIAANDPVSIEQGILHSKLTPSGTSAIPFTNDKSHSKIMLLQGRAGETKYLTFDFGAPIHGYPYLTVEAVRTTPVIDFAYAELALSPRTGEALVKPDGWVNSEAIVGKGYIDRVTTRTGYQDVELPDERTARWFTLHIYFPQDGTLKLRRVGFISSQYPVTIRGSFHAGDASQDKVISQIVHLSREHAEISMSDVYVDTPGREDGEWLEDARLRGELAAQWFGDTKLRQLFLRLVAESEHNGGEVHPFPPSNYPLVSTFDWAAEWVGALYDDYMWTGETTRISAYWPQLAAYWGRTLSYVQPDGLWTGLPVYADIRVGVHAKAGQSSGIVTAQLIDRLALAITMARAIHHDAEAAAWQHTHDLMLVAFRRDHLIAAADGIPLHVDDVADPVHADTQRGFSQAAQVYAVGSSLLTPAESLADLDYTFPAPNGSPPKDVTRWNNPTYLYRSLDALTRVGLSDRAMQHLLERFAPYLPGNPRNPAPVVLQGPFGGPLPEYWVSREDLGLTGDTSDSAQPNDPTGSHGWASVGLVWMHESLLGVRIAEPGGAKLAIAPDAAGMTSIEGTTITPHGPVHVALDMARASLSITLPANVSAHIVLPAPLAGLDSEAHMHVPNSCARAEGRSFNCTGQTLTFSSRP